MEPFRAEADLAAQAGNDFVLAQALRGQGIMLAYLGDPERGWGLCTRALGIATRRGDDLSVAQSHAACAAVAMEAGVELDAREHAVEAVRRSVRQFDVFALLVAVPVLALIDTRHDALARAGRLVGWYRGMTETTQASAPGTPPRSSTRRRPPSAPVWGARRRRGCRRRGRRCRWPS